MEVSVSVYLWRFRLGNVAYVTIHGMNYSVLTSFIPASSTTSHRLTGLPYYTLRDPNRSGLWAAQQLQASTAKLPCAATPFLVA